MQAAAEFVELFLERCRVQIQLARQPEEGEVVDRLRRLHFAAGAAEMRSTHLAARPAGERGRTGDRNRTVRIVICHKTHSPRRLPALASRWRRGAENSGGLQPENEVPHPQDFDAWGLTKTNPCCIRVSW